MTDIDNLESILLADYPNLYSALMSQKFYSMREALEDLAKLVDSFQPIEETELENILTDDQGSKYVLNHKENIKEGNTE